MLIWNHSAPKSTDVKEENQPKIRNFTITFCLSDDDTDTFDSCPGIVIHLSTNNIFVFSN